MPQLVRTPEEVLRDTKQDLYFIEFKRGFLQSKERIPGRKELLEWFKRELPHVELEDLGPPERSGIIEGGIGILVRVAFDEESLAKYCEAWEHEDGSSKTALWQCYLDSYERFLNSDRVEPPNYDENW